MTSYNWANICSGNDWLSDGTKPITWTRSCGINYHDIQTFSFYWIHLKMSSAKFGPPCPGLHMLNPIWSDILIHGWTTNRVGVITTTMLFPCTRIDSNTHWNKNVGILATFSSLGAQVFVKTYGNIHIKHVGDRFNMETPCNQYWISHYKDKTVSSL